LGAPIYRPGWQETFLNYLIPIWSGDTYMGLIAIGITTRALSTLARELSEPPRSVAFMLYGQDRVLAHPIMTEGSPLQSESASFPLLRNFGDPVIENLESLSPVRLPTLGYTTSAASATVGPHWTSLGETVLLM